MGPNEQNQHFAELRQKVCLYIHILVLQRGLPSLDGKLKRFLKKKWKKLLPDSCQTDYNLVMFFGVPGNSCEEISGVGREGGIPSVFLRHGPPRGGHGDTGPRCQLQRQQRHTGKYRTSRKLSVVWDTS